MTEPETLDEAKRNIVDEFTFLGDWTLRYEHIIDLGRGLGDLPDDAYRDFVCIETANAGNARVELGPGDTSTPAAKISL